MRDGSSEFQGPPGPAGTPGELGRLWDHVFVRAPSPAALGRLSDGQTWVAAVNAGMSRILGRAAEDLTGRAVAEIVHPDDEGLVRQRLAGLRIGDYESCTLEPRLVRGDGEIVWTRLALSCLDDTGHVLVVAENLQPLHRAQAMLARDQALLADAQREAELGSFEWDPGTERLVWSEGMFHLLGRAPTPVPSPEQFAALVHPEDMPTLREAWAAAEHGAGSVEIRARRTDGTPLLLHVRFRAEHDPSLDRRVVRGVVRNVLRERELEAAEREAQRLRACFRHTPLPSLLVERRGSAWEIEQVNDAWAALVDMQPEDLVGRPLRPLATDETAMAAALAGDSERFEGDGHVRHADGRRIPVALTAYPLPGSGGSALLHARRAAAHDAAPDAPPLSRRELEILRLVADGRSGREIAEALHLSAETIKTHLRRVYLTFGVSDRAAAVAYAFRSGLLD